MQHQQGVANYRQQKLNIDAQFSRKTVIGLIMVIALLAFEAFNYDTTRFALSDFLGDVRFVGISWASILAIAFCAIDFAGLARLFTPEQDRKEQQAVWYLMGAWMLGATLNAAMTWWAVSLTLLNHDFGNEVLSRAELLKIVPVFVAALVWLTRILFIGAFSVAGEHLFESTQPAKQASRSRVARPAAPRQRPSAPATSTPAPKPAVRRRPTPPAPNRRPGTAVYAKGKK